MVYSFLSHEMQTDAPDELLDQIILSEKQIPFEGQLNNPYRDALKQLFRDDKEQNQLRQVFGGITILQRSLPLHVLEWNVPSPYHLRHLNASIVRY